MHAKTARNLITTAALLATVILPIAAGAASGSKHDATLEATSADDDARGRVKVRIRGGDDGRFEIKVQRLESASIYELVVNGVKVGEILTSSGGSGKLRFRSRPRSSKDLFLGFDPRGAAVVVRNAAGSDVLAASISTDDNPDDGDIVCCVPDDSGPECEDRTPEECVAEGGIVSAATSCLPNPCEGAVVPGGDDDIICCIPDDSGPGCEDRTPGECALQGGIAVEAGSCLDNPCAAMPPSDPDTRCCLPDDSGAECEDRTPGECFALGGIDIGAGVCALDSCAGVSFPGGGGGTPGTGTAIVTCERRSSRSRISVDGKNLASGSYTAAVTSGTNSATAPSKTAIGDQVEFDFDSDPGDIAAGDTAISASFLVGTPPQVIAQILDAGGNVVADAIAVCEVR
jgi:hypothetical protein